MPRMSRTTTSRALLSAATRADKHARSREEIVCKIRGDRCVAVVKRPPSDEVIRSGRSTEVGKSAKAASLPYVTSRPDRARFRVRVRWVSRGLGFKKAELALLRYHPPALGTRQAPALRR